MPITTRDIQNAETLSICKTKIEHLEEKNDDLKAQIADLKKALDKYIADNEKKKERLSDRRLTIYLALASILGAVLLKGVELAITFLASV